MKFTEASVAKFKPPAGSTDYWVADDSLPGFGIRYRGGRAGVYGVRYSLGGQDRRLSYGPVSKIKLTDARLWARKQFTAVAEKTDPAVARAKAAAKVSDSMKLHIDEFLSHLAAEGRARTYIQENARSLKKYFAGLHRFGPNDIDLTMVSEQLKAIRAERGPIAAARSRAHLSGLYGWMMGEGLAKINPVHGTNKTDSKPRDRVLSDQEIGAIWNALDDGDDYSDVVRLLILVGARRDEIASLSWSEINFGGRQIELPSSRTKNRREFIIPLSPTALDILKARTPRESSNYVFGRGEGGFSGYSKAKAALDEKVKLARDWRLHDFRRTLSTVMHERLKILPHVVEATINHVSGHRAGVAGVYNRSEYLDDKRAALERYADHIAAIVGVAR
jgi:integrase